MANSEKKYNYSIIVNHGDGINFGCSRRCEYCNWQRLKGFGQSLPNIANENFENAKGYITISGGGDPLWSKKQASVMDYIPFVISQIIAKGYKPRIITREIRNFMAVSEETHAKIFLSLSYDEIVKSEILQSEDIRKFIASLAKQKLIEMTIVASATLDINEISRKIKYIASFQEMIGEYFPITIRENLRSVKYLKKDYIHELLEYIKHTIPEYDPEIRWLPAKVCLEDNIYIVAPHKCFGYHDHLQGKEITPNYAEVFNILSNNSHYMLFGSVARYIVAYTHLQTCKLKLPIFMPDYNDIDAFVEEDYLNALLDKLHSIGFTRYTRVSPHKYRVCHPLDASFTIDINLIKSIDIAKVIVSEALYNINRVGIVDGEILTFKGFSIDDLLTFKARELPHKWDYLNFQRRDKSEFQILNKLITNGWKIKRMNIFQRYLQAYYKLQAYIKRFIQRRKSKNAN